MDQEQQRRTVTNYTYVDQIKPVPLIMIDKRSNHSPSFPSIMYRMGKLVDRQVAEHQQFMEMISVELYKLCWKEGRIDPEQSYSCYKEKAAIYRSLIAIVQGKSKKID